MKLLIVEDNSSLAEITAELLRSHDRSPQLFEAITLAEDLQTALLHLPEHDAVLCDGTFPLSPDSTFLVEDWDVVHREAHRRGTHFVLYSGSARALDSARESSIPALTKPAAIEEIYAALTGRCLSVVDKSPSEAAPVSKNRDLKGDDHVANI
jgi:CheY-like chemotaxis protein